MHNKHISFSFHFLLVGHFGLITHCLYHLFLTCCRSFSCFLLYLTQIYQLSVSGKYYSVSFIPCVPATYIFMIYIISPQEAGYKKAHLAEFLRLKILYSKKYGKKCLAPHESNILTKKCFKLCSGPNSMKKKQNSMPNFAKFS